MGQPVTVTYGVTLLRGPSKQVPFKVKSMTDQFVIHVDVLSLPVWFAFTSHKRQERVESINQISSTKYPLNKHILRLLITRNEIHTEPILQSYEYDFKIP